MKVKLFTMGNENTILDVLETSNSDGMSECPRNSSGKQNRGETP
ncbi:hypothetical protein ACERII_07465 [Evansella sp. AB-rgal1]